jgi:uncharacterized membrane protein
VTTLADPRPYRVPAILLGIGLGGFFDGIVLHQILQWHHLVSSPVAPDTVANLELNTLADGLFHAATWLVTVVGVVALWRAAQLQPLPAAQYVLGGFLVGWGAFNLVEGIVDHHLLNLHHVRPGENELLWDVAFLAWGAVMVGVGWGLMRRAPARVASGGRPA